MPRADMSSWPYSAVPPRTPDPSPASGFNDPLLGLGSMFEAQARLWNHLLDANRSFWDFMSPWMHASPWMLNNALAVEEEKEKGMEPAETADGIPDAFEAQARSWNHFLDANRTFWTSLSWPVPGTPWLDASGAAAAPAANEDATEPQDAPKPRNRGAATKRGASRKTSRRSA